MKKRLILLVTISLISGVLYVPFIIAGNDEVNTITWLIFPLATAAAMLLFSWLGFIFIKKSVFEIPLLSAWEQNQKVSLKFLRIPILISLIFAVVVGVLNQLIETPSNPGTFLVRILTTPWAALVTEVVSHLFVMTGIYLIIKNRWISIVLSSTIFLVLFHLNGVEGNVTLTIYMGAMNFAASTLTGWFYSKYGFESAVIGHAVMHIIMLGVN